MPTTAGMMRTTEHTLSFIKDILKDECFPAHDIHVAVARVAGGVTDDLSTASFNTDTGQNRFQWPTIQRLLGTHSNIHNRRDTPAPSPFLSAGIYALFRFPPMQTVLGVSTLRGSEVLIKPHHCFLKICSKSLS